MRYLLFILFSNLVTVMPLGAQVTAPTASQKDAIYSLIEDYSRARENRDTVLLKRILTRDVDQLVSTGEWRNGIQAAVQGMLRSSANSPGTRTLQVEKLRMLTRAVRLLIAVTKYKTPTAPVVKCGAVLLL